LRQGRCSVLAGLFRPDVAPARRPRRLQPGSQSRSDSSAAVPFSERGCSASAWHTLTERGGVSMPGRG
jgi:hypothetical protein